MAFTIGIDIGGTKISAGLVSNGRVIKRINVPTEAKKGKTKVINNILFAINEIFNKTKKIKGMGIGVPGQFDRKGSIIQLPNIPKLKNVNLKKTIQNKFRIKKVELSNDANCFALAEAMAGKGKNFKNIVGVILGTGAGTGIIINKKIYPGRDFLAGEFGMITFKGKKLEEFCAGRFIEAEARKLKLGKTDPKLLQEMAKKNKKAKKIYEKAGENIGYLLSIIANAVNPDIIILGGGVSNAFSLFKGSMLKSFKKNLVYKQLRTTKIVKSELKNPGILGAALLVE